MIIQEKLYTLFETPNKSRSSLILNGIIYVLIIVSIVNLMLISVPAYEEKYGHIFILIRNIIMPIFVIEYILRLYASGYLNEYKGLKGRLKYALTPYAIIDFLSILPYFLVSVGFNSSFIRSLRLLRVFRLLRVRKYTIFIQLIKKIINNIKEEITVLLFFTFIVLIILSFVMYDIEHRVQPEVFTDIFQTMWWSVATLTTVGYGDMYPITAAGKLVTSMITIMGIGFIAIPGGMFASEFISEIIKNREEEKNNIENITLKCIKCGSESIETYSDPKLSFSKNTFNYQAIKICDNCNFTWLENQEEVS